MKILDKKVLETSIINGKEYPKKSVYLVDKLPKLEKGNNKTLDTIFYDGNIQMGGKRK